MTVAALNDIRLAIIWGFGVLFIALADHAENIFSTVWLYGWGLFALVVWGCEVLEARKRST